MPDSLEARVKRMVADVLNVPAAQVTRETSPQSVDNWDSVQHLNLVLAMESEFGVSVPPEDIDKLRTVGDIIDAVRRMAGGNAE
jgi:acyl carrier protein